MPVLVSAYFRARRADGTHPRSAAACAISPDPRRFAGHRRGRDGRRARPHRPSCRKTTTIRGRNELLACFGLAVLAPRRPLDGRRRDASRRESLFREWTTNGNASQGTNCEFDHFPRSETILFSVRNLFEVTAPQVALHRSKSPRRRAPRPAAGPPTRAIADARARSHHGHRAATVTPQLQEADVDRDGRSA